MTKLGSFLRDFLTPTVVLILGGVVAHDHLAPHDAPVGAPAVNGKALGRKYAVAVAASFGDAWQVAADALASGKSIADSQAALQAKWQAGRSQAFATLVAPEFNKVLGEGLEPVDPPQRAAVVNLWRDFATGLKGGR